MLTMAAHCNRIRSPLSDRHLDPQTNVPDGLENGQILSCSDSLTDMSNYDVPYRKDSLGQILITLVQTQRSSRGLLRTSWDGNEMSVGVFNLKLGSISTDCLLTCVTSSWPKKELAGFVNFLQIKCNWHSGKFEFF